MMKNGKLDPALALLITLYLAGILSANATAAKLVNLWGVAVTTGALAIPLVYLTTDLLNELYGPSATRSVVWMGFWANAILAGFSRLCLWVPASTLGASQGAFEEVFLSTPRIIAASMAAYLVSSLVDVWVFHALRVATQDRHFWLRKNGSTVVSQAIDSGLFVLVAFAGVLPWGVMLAMATGQYLIKMVAAPLGTPLTYLVLAVARRGIKLEVSR